jgi:hypothetical protein
MKIKKYIDVVSEKNFWDDEEDKLKPNYDGDYEEDDEEDDEEDGDYEEENDYEDGDHMEHLKYLLREFFKRNSISDVEIRNRKMDIMIYIVLDEEENLNKIVNIFEVISLKIKKDILPQYDSEFELWETKSGHPMFVFNFYYDGGGSSSEKDDDYYNRWGSPF